MSPLSPARASVQHLAPQSPAMLAAKNPTSEWNTTEEKCDTAGLLAIGKVLGQSAAVTGDDLPERGHEVVPKIEPVDDEPAQSYFTLKVDVASEDGDSASDDEHYTIDLSTKPSHECPEVTTTVYCNTPVNNNNNNINNNNNNNNNNNDCDGEKIAKGSAKRKKPNPMQIVWAKKSKFQDETEETDSVDSATTAAADDLSEDKDDDDSSSTVATMTIVAATMTTTTTTMTATTTTTTTTTGEDEPVTVKRKNSSKSTDAESEQEILDDCMSEEILRSVLTDESDGDDMISEAFVKKKGVPKKTKKGRKDRKNGANKKEMTGQYIIIIL